MPARHRLAPAGARDGVEVEQGQLQQLRTVPHRGHRRACQVDQALTIEGAQSDVVAAGGQCGHGAQQRPGAEGRRHQQGRQSQRHDLACRRHQQQAAGGWRNERPAQVVDHLPALDERQRHALRADEEWQQLPVAARPAAQTRRRHVGVHGCLLDDGDVADASAARDRAFEQVVAEHLFGGQAPDQRGVHSGNVHQAFACEAAFAEEVLVDL